MRIETRSDIIDLLNFCEKKFNTKEWKINNDHIWPMIRFELGYMLYWKLEKLEYKRSLRKYFINAAIGLLRSFGSIKTMIFGLNKNNSDVIFFTDTGGYSKLNEYWYEKNCDLIIDDISTRLNLRCIKIDYNYNNFYPKYINSYQIRTILDIITLKRFIFRKKHQNINLKGYVNFVEFCNENGLEFSLKNKSKLIDRYSIWKANEQYFINKILQKNIKLCFVLTYYGFHSSAMVSACKFSGIPVIDIQHGIQGETHFAYSSWTNIPDGGFNLLPNYFWCWTDNDSNNINKWAHISNSSTSLAFAGGNSFLNLFLTPNGIFLSKLTNNLRSKIDSTKKTILYTCNLYEYEVNNEAVLEIIKKTQNDFNWLIRLHPQEKMFTKKFEKLLNNAGIYNTQIEWSTNAPLYGLLSCSDLHITQMSSAIIEAESLMVKSIALDVRAFEMYKDQFSKKSCVYMQPGEVIDFLHAGDYNSEQKTITKNCPDGILVIDKILKESCSNV